jgi:hypothetical protein
MAPGFKRLPGKSRNYINAATGQVLSRRQYDKLVAASTKAAKPAAPGSRGFTKLPGSARRYVDNATGQTISRRQRDNLADALGQRTRKPLSPSLSAKQRQYNALLESYVRNRRRQGFPISKSEARKSEDFKRAVRMIRTRRRVGETDMQRDARLEARRMGIEAVGGHQLFQEAYDDQLAQALEEGELEGA